MMNWLTQAMAWDLGGDRPTMVGGGLAGSLANVAKPGGGFSPATCPSWTPSTELTHERETCSGLNNLLSQSRLGNTHTQASHGMMWGHGDGLSWSCPAWGGAKSPRQPSAGTDESQTTHRGEGQGQGDPEANHNQWQGAQEQLSPHPIEQPYNSSGHGPPTFPPGWPPPTPPHPTVVLQGDMCPPPTQHTHT